MPNSGLNTKQKIQANKALQGFMTAEILRLGDLQDAIQAYSVHLKIFRKVMPRILPCLKFF
ncbi:MAG: hypothetical protein HWD58_15970 [Bacteroidota bacterium]|nr:MAG: hypothetical protein HWD58_15970 [Bacteroidota bacterium]